ncbi:MULTISPECIES: hypothetical protein [Deinococcus]|uniref:hypothetical protein n=1 Tax=Deinococcus TaxID=1298 RepID=UPI000550CC3E|nr:MULTISPECIES: hypothetical protein [Deinococcus]MBI0445515.1 hypothetical protein [Deinococcus sp. DB0503]
MMLGVAGLALGLLVLPGRGPLRGNAPDLTPGRLRAVNMRPKSGRPTFLKPTGLSAWLNLLNSGRPVKVGSMTRGWRPDGKWAMGVQPRRAERDRLLLCPFHGLMPGSAGHA